MNTKFAVASMASALLLVMTATVSVISLNMGKPMPEENSVPASSATSSCTTTALTALSETAKAIRTETTAVYVSGTERTTVSAFTTESVKMTKAVTKTASTESTAIKETTVIEKPQETTGKPTAVENTATENAVKETTFAEKPPETTAKTTSEHTTEQTTITASVTEIQTTTTVPVEIPVFADVDIFSVTPQSTDGVDEFLAEMQSDYKECYNVTPAEITEKYGFRIFQFEKSRESYISYDGEIYHIGNAFGDTGVGQCAVSDLNCDGYCEIYYSYAYGSGILTSQIDFFDTHTKEITKALYYQEFCALGFRECDVFLNFWGNAIDVYDYFNGKSVGFIGCANHEIQFVPD